MFAIELQQEIEREFNIKIGLNHMLKEYEEGELEHIENYFAELKITLNSLLKYKFIIPTEMHTHLNGGLVISKLILKGMVNKAVIIDICSGIKIKDDILTDKCILELLFTFIEQNLPSSYVEKTIRVVSTEPD